MPITWTKNPAASQQSKQLTTVPVAAAQIILSYLRAGANAYCYGIRHGNTVLRGPNQLSGFAGLICMARETHTTDDAMSPRL